MEKSLSKWYSKQWLVILLCVFFFPVGLYGLWKSASFSKGGKIAITIIIAFFIFAQISNQFDTADQSASTTNENIAELSRLSTSANRLIAEYKLDSAKLSIDSLKIIGADTAYVKAMEDAIVEKKSFIKNIEGSYLKEEEARKKAKKKRLSEEQKEKVVNCLVGSRISDGFGEYTFYSNGTFSWEVTSGPYRQYRKGSWKYTGGNKIKVTKNWLDYRTGTVTVSKYCEFFGLKF